MGIDIRSYDAVARTVLIRWPAISGASSYTITYSTDSGESWNSYRTGLKNNYANFNNVVVGVAYYFIVYGVTSSGETLGDYESGKFIPFEAYSEQSQYVYKQPAVIRITGASDAEYTVEWSYSTVSGDVSIPDAVNSLTYIPDSALNDLKVVVKGTGASAYCVSTIVIGKPDDVVSQANWNYSSWNCTEWTLSQWRF